MPVARRSRLKQPPAPPVLHHRVYVVRLRNPLGDGRDGYYVGMTGLTPEERFDNHTRGYRSAKVVTRCGVALAPEWYGDIPPMTFADAALCEPTLADELRDLGHLVFGPTNRPAPGQRGRKKR